MKSILVSGGNSGIGLAAAREIVSQGHRVIILGRDRRKGEEALASFGVAGKRASFIPVELSTQIGVREAATRVLAETDRIDALLHSAGILTVNDIRTADGLSLYFSINYMSRYHLTQLLLPALRRSDLAHVIMMTPKADLSTKIDFQMFPKFEPFDWRRMGEQITISNHHFAAHLTKTEPKLRAGVVNAGGANTDIMRNSPWYMRVSAKILMPLFFNSVEESAYNAVHACLRDDWQPATYWAKPGHFEQQTPIDLDESITRNIMHISQKITGV